MARLHCKANIILFLPTFCSAPLLIFPTRRLVIFLRARFCDLTHVADPTSFRDAPEPEPAIRKGIGYQESFQASAKAKVSPVRGQATGTLTLKFLEVIDR